MSITQAAQLMDQIERLTEERNELLRAERETSDAYLRIRKIVGAWDTKPGGVDRFEVTETKVMALVTELDRERKLRVQAAEDAQLYVNRTIALRQALTTIVVAAGGMIGVPDAILLRVPPDAELTQYHDDLNQETVFRVRFKGGPDAG